MFKVVRFDGIVLVIPKRYVDELRSLPEHRLSARQLTVYVRGLDLFQIPSCVIS